jgi:hypothetical protein
MVDFEERAKALADYLGIPVESVEIEDDPYDDARCEYDTSDGTFIVMTYDEAKEAMKDYEEELIDDVGLEGFSDWFQDWIIDNALSPSDWFEDVCREDWESYASDIEYESNDTYGTRLAQECVENGIISDDDFVDGEYVGDLNLEEELAEYLFNQAYEDYNGNFHKWYVDNFGDEDLRDLLKNGSVSMDIDAIVEQLIQEDGFGPSLAVYDGEEHELADDRGYIQFYAFRVN